MSSATLPELPVGAAPVHHVPRAATVRRRLAPTARVLVAGWRLLGVAWAAFVTWFAVGAIVAGAISGTGLFLGAGAIVDMVVGGAANALLVGVLWLVVRGARRLLGALVVRLASVLERRARGRVLRLVARAVAALGRWLRRPRRSSGLALAVVGLVALVELGQPFRAVAPHNVYLPGIVIGAISGALLALAAVVRPHRLDDARPRLRLASAAVAVVVATTLVGSGLAWAAWEGPGSSAAAPPISVAAADIDLPDPGQPGPYAVRTTSYGAGIDPRRPEYGPNAPILTGTVDASKANPDMAWPGGDYTRWFIGGGMDRLPLNALVWYPDGAGPFPLVLIVHGNHAMGDYSERGYAYLGEHLASRGFILASVDEASLNGDMFGDFLGNEMPVRAWVLLKHLELWRAWSTDPASPFFGLVDTDHVALMGHSRGGEAAAVAATLAHASPSAYPTLAPFPTGLDVDAVVGIAPPDGQWEGAGHGANTLSDVDYLTIQGGLDADMAWWASLRQFARTVVAQDPATFKAAIWVRRANHGRFNTVWDLGDTGTQGEFLLDRAAVLSPAEQQDVARTVIAAFLEASLMGRDGYRALFAVPAAGRDWLPADSYVTRLAEGTTVRLADVDAFPATPLRLVGEGSARILATELTTRSEGVTQGNKAAAVRWTEGDAGAAAALELPSAGGPLDGVALTGDSTLRFAIASASLDPAAGVPSVTVELADAAGRTAAVPLAVLGGVFPPIATQPFKSADAAGIAGMRLSIASEVETHLQTFALPFAAFEAATPDLDLATLRTIRFRLAGPASAAVYLDEIGIDAGT